MALIRKLLEGGTSQANEIPEFYSINNVPAKKYFLIGDDWYDLKKFENLVWHNFDAWIDEKRYNNKIKGQAKLFINQVLEQLGTNEAKFNSDRSLEMIDKDELWDNRPGFNKRGPKSLHWVTGDKIDDNRGIPHIAMNYLLAIIASPYMKKKPEPIKVSNLTGKVLNLIIKSDFNNDFNKFSADDGFLSYDLRDRIRMFEEALDSFRKYTDFSVYDNKSLKSVDDNIKGALLLLKESTIYDDTFFDKMSLYGFHGVRKWLDKEASGEESDSEIASNSEHGTGTSEEDSGTTRRRLRVEDINKENAESILHALDRRRYSKYDYEKYVKNMIYASLNDYYRLDHGEYGNSWRDNHSIGFRRTPVTDDIIKTESLFYDSSMADTGILDPYMQDLIGKALTRLLVQYVYGLNTENFYSKMDKNKLIQNIKLVMSRANGNNGQGLFAKTLLSDNVYYIVDSYDDKTKAYLALDVLNKALFALPSIFVDSRKWGEATSRINAALNNSGVPFGEKYTVEDILRLSFKRFVNEVKIKNSGRFFSDMRNYLLLFKKSGGIIKAFTGTQLLLSTGTPTSARNYLDEINLLRADLESLRQTLLVDRENKLAAKDAYREMESLRKEYDFKKRLDVVIKSWSDLKNNLDTHDAFVIHTLLSDLVALGGSLSGGAFNPVTDVATLSSIIGTIGTVATDESMSLGLKLFYGTLGVGLNVAGLFPVAGGAANAVKLGRVAKLALPILSKLVRYGALGITGVNALGPLGKLAKGQPLTKGEWTDLAYFAEAVIMGNIGRRALRDYRRYTKPVDQKTTYYVNTKGGQRIPVSQEVYNKLNGNTIKEVKANLGEKGKLKDINGNEIHLESLKTSGLGKLANKGKISGSIEETSAGVRLKTLEELRAEYGIPKITVNGQTTYEVPKGYLGVARKLHQLPLVSLEEPTGNPSVTGERVVVKATDTEPSTKKNFTGEKESPNSKNGGNEGKTEGGNEVKGDGNTDSKPIETPGESPNPNPSPSPSTGEVKSPTKPGGGTKELTPDQQKMKEKLENVDLDVKLVVKDFILDRYRGLFDTLWGSKRFDELLSKVLSLKDVSGKNFPKEIKRGYTYFVKPNGLVTEVRINDSKSYKGKLKYYNGKGGYHRFTFKPGGILKFLDPASKIERADGEDPNELNLWDKTLRFTRRLLYNPDFYLGLGKVNSDRLANDVLKLHKLETPFTRSMPSSNLYITNPDVYNVYNLANKTKGANNSTLGIFGRSGSSDMWVDTGLKYLTSIVDNETIDDKKNTTVNNLINTYTDNYNKELKAKDEERRLISDANRQAIITHNNNLLNYLSAYYANKAKTWSDILGVKYNSALSRKEAELAFNTKITEYALKRYGPYINQLRDLSAKIKKYREDKLESNASWTGRDDILYLELVKKYNNLLSESGIYLLKNAFDASQDEIGSGFDDLMDKLNIKFKGYIPIKNDNSGDEKEYFNYWKNDSQNEPNNYPMARGGGSLSYEDRMNLKKLDAKNKKLEMYYRMILEDHKQAALDRRLRDREYSEAKRLINRKSEILLKASLLLK